MPGRSTLAALALVALVACGGDAEPEAQPTTAPPTTPAPTPSTTTPAPGPTFDLPPSEAIVGLTLAEAAVAQEAYHVDAGAYTKDLATLRENGFDGDDDVVVTIVSADRDSYCLKAVGGGHTVYYSSDLGQVSKTPCS